MIIRQGDILLQQVPSAPAGVEPLRQAQGETRKADKIIVGYGEATGHHHVIANAQWLVAPEVTDADLHQFALGRKNVPVFVCVETQTELTHEEHAPILIAPGIWRIMRQREYSPAELHIVAD